MRVLSSPLELLHKKMPQRGWGICREVVPSGLESQVDAEARTAAVVAATIVAMAAIVAAAPTTTPIVISISGLLDVRRIQLFGAVYLRQRARTLRGSEQHSRGSGDDGKC